MIKNDTTPLIIEITKSFVGLLRRIAPSWEKAYLRICLDNSSCEAKGSFVADSGVTIIDVIKNKDFFYPINDKGQELIELLGKEQGVFLLVVKSSLEYEFKFDYENLSRWKITKMDGGTGVPEDI